MPRKPDADLIEQFIDSLPGELNFLDGRRLQWPRFVYRFDDVRSVAKILMRGALLSRNRCDELGIPFIDAAHRGIIDRTPQLHRYARLFLRPRTPTQYLMEGIRPALEIGQQPGSPHCPVPAFLFFDAKEVLTRADSQFTDGSPTRMQCSWGNDVGFLERIPFDAVYHDEALPPEQKSEIKFRRHAEILVPDELDLEGLREIVCRTVPERDTLLDLLGAAAPRWEPLARVERYDERIFTRRGLFVESVTLQDESLWIDVHIYPGAFDVHATVVDAESGATLFDEHRPAKQFQTKRNQIRLAPGPRRVHVKLTVDSALAFSGTRARERVLG